MPLLPLYIHGVVVKHECFIFTFCVLVFFHHPFISRSLNLYSKFYKKENSVEPVEITPENLW